MRKFETFAIKESSIEGIYLLVPHPFTSDIYDIIEEFNGSNLEIKTGKVLMDLQTIVGNRKEKYVLLEIINFKLVRKKIKVYFNVTNELNLLKNDYYSKLDKRVLKYLKPTLEEQIYT
ncbi:hypothetical protein MST22_17835 [Virgibacillus halodenitrificans]|uniref:hypothetical protein n=1 Tax=Virgibacillus halodenitrificans TaxID=1482 RepID=UPI001FB2C891|nr:hypothetical protein [Virgibacillus halodenitrificans]MCJ0933016.1 hypothetical protein [Virgibacillus halodenitrificans]